MVRSASKVREARSTERRTIAALKRAARVRRRKAREAVEGLNRTPVLVAVSFLATAVGLASGKSTRRFQRTIALDCLRAFSLLTRGLGEVENATTTFRSVVKVSLAFVVGRAVSVPGVTTESGPVLVTGLVVGSPNVPPVLPQPTVVLLIIVRTL